MYVDPGPKLFLLWNLHFVLRYTNLQRRWWNKLSFIKVYVASYSYLSDLIYALKSKNYKSLKEISLNSLKIPD